MQCVHPGKKAPYELYTAATPNGHKISIMLEELGVPYDVINLDLSKDEQKAPAYVGLNPNGKIPTLIDREAGNFAIFESGAILLYLAQKTGKLWASAAKEQSEIVQWLMFQVGGLGPMQGQANVFVRYFPENIPSVIKRYQSETMRIYDVLDKRLANREFICSTYSIADVAVWPWVRGYKWPRLNLDGLKNLSRWNDAMAARPACQRGLAVPASLGSSRTIDAGTKMIARGTSAK